jgi:hypothetical protein
MKFHKLALILPMLLFILCTSCDSHNSRSANAQDEEPSPAAMSGTDVTGAVNAPSEQTCPTLIGGIDSGDTLVVEIDVSDSTTGDVTLSNTTKGTSASCSGDVDGVPPASLQSCKVSSSTISGIKSDDMLIVDITFSAQTKQVSLANLSAPTGITCAYVTIETLDAM